MTTDFRKEFSELLKDDGEYMNPNGIFFSVKGLELRLSMMPPCSQCEDLALVLDDRFPEELFAQLKLKSIADVDALHPRTLWAQYKAGNAKVNVLSGPSWNATSLLLSIKNGKTFVAEYGGEQTAVLEQVLGNMRSILAYARRY